MTHFVFPDNTVLCNFAAVNRLDLLETVLLGRGRWTEAVAHEGYDLLHLMADKDRGLRLPSSPRELL